MTSVGVRQAVYGALAGDTQLVAAGYGPDSIYPNFAPDSPAERRFIVLRWGPITPGVGGAHSGDLGVWAYNRDEDYAPIEAALQRVRALLAPFPGTRIPSGGAFLGVDWGGTGADLYDDAYQAWTRPENYTITASGN